MKYTIKNADVSTYSELRISTKHAVKVCKKINRKKFDIAKKYIENLLNRKISIDRKYNTKTTKEILNVLNSLENNARVKNLDPIGMELFISAHIGTKLLRGRRKRMFGMILKNTTLQAFLKKGGK